MTCENTPCKNKARLKVWSDNTYIFCCDDCRVVFESATTYTVEMFEKKKSVKK